jgi:3-hydroxybutyryl-CoA dehydrogenase
VPESLRVAMSGSTAIAAELSKLITSAGHHVVALDLSAAPREPVDVLFETRTLDQPDTSLSEVVALVSADAIVVALVDGGSVSALGAPVTGPHRFAAWRLFGPVQAGSFVEVVPGEATSDDVAGRLVDLATSFGLAPVLTKDRPGFLIDRLLVPFLNDVIQAFDDGLASADALDTAVRLGLGHPAGPLELLDELGLDTHLARTTALYSAQPLPEYSPPPLLARMVEAGRTGAGSGTGFRTKIEEVDR